MERPPCSPSSRRPVFSFRSSPNRTAVRTALYVGARDMAPLLLGVLPFATLYGMTAGNAGLSASAALGLSVFVYAGAAQLAVVQLLGTGATAVVVGLTALVINLRFLMYSASLARHLRHLQARWSWPLAYLLTDQVYALSVARFSGSSVRALRPWYYLGAALFMWGTWQLGTAVGFVFGAGVPAAWGLDFAVPLTFLGLLAQTIDDAATGAAAVSGGLVAVLAVPLPMNLGIIVGALAGVGTGVIVETARSRTRS